MTSTRVAALAIAVVAYLGREHKLGKWAVPDWTIVQLGTRVVTAVAAAYVAVVILIWIGLASGVRA